MSKRLSLLVITAASLALSGCVHHESPLTVAPHSIVTARPSFDGNAQNSGLISCNDTGCLVTPHFLDRHGLKLSDRGVSAEGPNYRLTAEVISRCVDQDQARKKQQH